MKVTNKITIHLDDPQAQRPVSVMQCDVHTRVLEIALFAGGKRWEIPDGVTPVISYHKPDGTGGLYDTLPDGSSACRMDKNTVCAILPPPALEAAGRVDLVVIFTDNDGNQLATFGIPIDVHRNPGVGAVASGNYFNLQKWVKETAVAAVPKALPNPQKLILTGAVEAEYDGSGEVEVEIPVGGSKDVHIGSEPPTNGEAIWINPDEEPEGGGGAVSPEAIKQAVGEYMVEHPETDPTVPAWAKQPEKPKYTAEEVGALPADTPLPSGGGSGSVIADITLTEDVSAAVLCDGIDCRKVAIYVYGCINDADRSLADGGGSLALRINDVKYSAPIPLFVRKEHYYTTCLFIECIGGWAMVDSAQFSNKSWDNKTSKQAICPYNTFEGVNSIRKLEIQAFTSGHLLLSGSKIKVVGI